MCGIQCHREQAVRHYEEQQEKRYDLRDAVLQFVHGGRTAAVHEAGQGEGLQCRVGWELQGGILLERLVALPGASSTTAQRAVQLAGYCTAP